MRGARGILLSGLMVASLPGQLPEWSDDDLAALESGELVPGSVLLVAPSELAVELDAIAAEEAELAAVEDLDPVPEPFLEAYFGSRPERHLLDPQGLLSPDERSEREEFLDYHAADSRIDFFVYIFGGDQWIPGEARHEELAERFFAEGKPALVVCYFLGAPERTEVQLSPSLAGAISESEQRRLVHGATLAARGKTDPVEQLAQFCVQASIRLYWMEKEAGLADVAVASPEADLPPQAPLPADDDGVIRTFLEAWGLTVAGAAAAAIAGLALALVIRWRARYRFPEFEAEPRLGGAHAAGVGAVLAFGNTTQGPARQRSGPSDSLGGI